MRKCCLCGKNIIEGEKHYGFKLHRYLFRGWVYQLEKKDLKKEFCMDNIDLIVKFDNNFWKVVGYTKVQREIIWFIWKHTLGMFKMKMYECDECYNKEEQLIRRRENVRAKQRTIGRTTGKGNRNKYSI